MPALEVMGKVYEFSVDGRAILYNGKVIEYELISTSAGKLVVKIGRTISEFTFSQSGTEVELFTVGGTLRFKLLSDRALLLREFRDSGSEKCSHADIRAPMPGLVVKILVEKGDRVKTGTAVVVLEAMKMENEIRVLHDAEIADVMVREGDTVEKDEVIAVLR